MMQVTLGHPILVAIYSTALLLIGSGVGVHWNHKLPTALWLCAAGGILMAAHDLATGFVWFWLTAKWARSVIIQRNNRG
jgi:disulfide bond formation protein DsbB